MATYSYKTDGAKFVSAVPGDITMNTGHIMQLRKFRFGQQEAFHKEVVLQAT